jgi:hypothetical protein
MSKKVAIIVIKRPKPSKVKVYLKCIFSPVFYVWAIMFALAGIFFMVIEETMNDKKKRKQAFEDSVKELKESVKRDTNIK